MDRFPPPRKRVKQQLFLRWSVCDEAVYADRCFGQLLVNVA